MEIRDRIEQAPACEVIRLTEQEKRSGIYTGAGWKLAKFDGNGRLAELFDPFDHMPYLPDVSESATIALGAAVDWAQGATGEIWLVMCSCHELCEPEPFDPMSAASIAKLGRRIGETVSEI